MELLLEANSASSDMAACDACKCSDDVNLLLLAVLPTSSNGSVGTVVVVVVVVDRGATLGAPNVKLSLQVRQQAMITRSVDTCRITQHG